MLTWEVYLNFRQAFLSIESAVKQELEKELGDPICNSKADSVVKNTGCGASLFEDKSPFPLSLVTL